MTAAARRKALLLFLLLPALAALCWQAFAAVRDGGVSGYRAGALVLAAAAALWWGWQRRGRRPAVLVRAAMAVGTATVFWASALELVLDRVTVLALGSLLLVALWAVHVTVAIAATRPAGGDNALSRVVLGLSLSVSALAVLLCAVEAVFRVTYPLGLYAIIPDDPAQGQAMELRPDGRHVGRPGFKGAYVHPEFRGTRVEFNGYGLRDGLDEASPPAEGALSVLVLGDSFAFGTGVSLEETFHEQLEARAAEITARPLRVYGGAMSGYGTSWQLAMLEQLAPLTRPDAVVLALYEGNDFLDNWNEERAAAGAGEDPEVAALRPRLTPLQTYLQGVVQFRYWAVSSAAVQATGLEQALVALGLMTPRVHLDLFLDKCFLREPPELVLRMRDRVVQQLVRFRDRCRELGAAPVVLLVPEMKQVLPDRFDAYLRTVPPAERDLYSRLGFHQGFVAELERHGIASVDMVPPLEAEVRAGRGCYHLEGHWNARGHAVAADVLVPVLKELLASR